MWPYVSGPQQQTCINKCEGDVCTVGTHKSESKQKRFIFTETNKICDSFLNNSLLLLVVLMAKERMLKQVKPCPVYYRQMEMSGVNYGLLFKRV